jgi:hypothetical protein
MGREHTLAKVPLLAAAHLFLLRRLAAPYTIVDLSAQAAWSALLHRREPWRSAAHDLPAPYQRTSDTLFVLGSGESINLLPDEAWATVGDADSLGLNFWLLHDFVPTGYVQEWIGPSDDPLVTERHAVRRKILERREDELAGVPFFFRTPARRRHRGKRATPADVDDQLGLPAQQVAVTFDLTMFPLAQHDFARVMAFARRARLLADRPTWRYLTTSRGTVLWALLFAARTGYRKVVLCGVDLHGTRYFYEDPDAPRVRHDLPLPPNLQSGAVHRTNDPSVPGATMREIIAVLHPLLADLGVELSVAHPSSVLAEDLPLYAWPGSNGR